jgi:hypothetical protein
LSVGVRASVRNTRGGTLINLESGNTFADSILVSQSVGILALDNVAKR